MALVQSFSLERWGDTSGADVEAVSMLEEVTSSGITVATLTMLEEVTSSGIIVATLAFRTRLGVASGEPAELVEVSFLLQWPPQLSLPSVELPSRNALA